MDDLDAKLNETMAQAREIGFCRGLYYAAKVASESGDHALSARLLTRINTVNTRDLASSAIEKEPIS